MIKKFSQLFLIVLVFHTTISDAGVFRKIIEADVAVHIAKTVARHRVFTVMDDIREAEALNRKRLAIKRGQSAIKEVEQITNRKISKEQKGYLIESMKQHEFGKMNKGAIDDTKKEFESNRKKMIREWEQHYGEKWPTYVNKNGATKNYDLHHIIPKAEGGPNTWWNSHPALNPSEHQGGIHASGSVLSELQKLFH